MRMSRVLISKRAELDTITMQRRPNYYHYHKKMLLKIAKRSILQRQQRPDVAGWVINRSVQQQNMTQFHSSACVALHCKQYVPLIANRTEGTLFMVPASTHTQRTFHTATSPSGTDSHVLFSTRWGKFTSQDDARRQVARLSAEERGHLEKAIKDLKERSEETQSEPPSWNQLKLLCYQNALPFIGFGFLDNVIMISVGEYIDTTIGVTLAISTMAAAGIGNMISDLAGLGLADQVEALCRRLGIPNPNLSSAQLRHRSSRWMGLIGRCVGIIIGCTIGMAPLLWFDDPHKESDHES